MLRRQVVLLLAAALLTQTAVAAPGRNMEPGRDRGGMHGRRLSLDEAVARVERRFHARAIKAEQRNEGGRLVYRIRLLSEDGRVFEVSVDAESGAVE